MYHSSRSCGGGVSTSTPPSVWVYDACQFLGGSLESMGGVLWTFILNIVPKTIPIGEIQSVRELNSIMRTSCNNNYIINIGYEITVECNFIILILSFKRYKYYPVVYTNTKTKKMAVKSVVLFAPRRCFC